MTNPLNPNTLLPMSLEVDKIQQIKQLHAMEKQSLIARQRDAKNEKLQTKVNAKDESDSVKIREDESDSNKNFSANQKNQDHEQQDDEKEQQQDSAKGNYIDIKI